MASVPAKGLEDVDRLALNKRKNDIMRLTS